MQIIQANTSHLDQLVNLFDAYRVWYRKTSDKTSARQFLKERIEAKESIIYVVKDEQENLLGFTQLYPIFSSTRMKRMWLLNDLFVAPEARGKGVSKLLIGAAQKLCIEGGAGGILLETEVSNNIGNELYPRMGFELEKNNFYFWTA